VVGDLIKQRMPQSYQFMHVNIVAEHRIKL